VKQQGPTDDRLMLLVHETGDHEAFSTLVERYQKPLYRYLYRFTGDRYAAEDLFQETFMRIYQARSAFNPKLSFSAWAYRIATNACIDRQKKKVHTHEKAAGQETISRQASPHDSPEGALLKQAKGQRVLELLTDLPEKYRAVLVMMHYQEMPLKAIASALDIPVGTVKSRLYKGFKQLTALAEKQGLSDEV